MTRTTYRRTPRLEILEKREVLNGPTADQQYMLALVNLARTNPSEAAERFTSNLDPNVIATLNYYNINPSTVKNIIANMPAKPPLAWNDQLAQAAEGQSQDMANTGVQSHTGSDGSSLGTRLDRVGYTNTTSTTENAYAYATSVDEAMEAFMLDWGVASNGHRDNIMEPDKTPDQALRDVGIGIVASSRPNFGPEVITQDFGAQAGEKPELLGVAFNDRNGDNFYQPGEGQAGVTIVATNESTGQTTSTQTMDAGGYQIPLGAGTYLLKALVGNQVIRSEQVQIGNVNVEKDYNLSQPWQGSAPAVTPAAQILTMAPTPPSPPASTPTPIVAPNLSTSVITNPTPPTVTVTQPVATPQPVVKITQPVATPQPAVTVTQPVLPASQLSDAFPNTLALNGWSSWTVKKAV